MVFEPTIATVAGGLFSRNIRRHISLIWRFSHRYRHSPWPVDVTELFPRFCCWTLIWLSRHWAWPRQGYWRYRGLIDWLVPLTGWADVSLMLWFTIKACDFPVVYNYHKGLFLSFTVLPVTCRYRHNTVNVLLQSCILGVGLPTKCIRYEKEQWSA